MYGRKHKTNDEWVGVLKLHSRGISAVTKGKQHQTGGYEFNLKPREWSFFIGTLFSEMCNVCEVDYYTKKSVEKKNTTMIIFMANFLFYW